LRCCGLLFNHKWTRMNTNIVGDSAASSSDVSIKTTGRVLLFKDEVFQVIGCAIEVLNTLGHGLVEKPYENALVVEFSLRNIAYRQQAAFDVVYKSQKICLFVPDLIVFDAIVVDTKVIDRIADRLARGSAS